MLYEAVPRPDYSEHREKREAEYILDLNIFNGILETHTRSLTDLTKAVEKISDKLDELAKITRDSN